MLTELCAELHNYFLPEGENSIHHGRFSIKNGVISPAEFLKDGQYFRICGSVFNDGVHKFPLDTALEDEEFDGSVWAMAVPPAVVALSKEIDEYVEKNEPSAFTSESFGGYSYTRAKNSKGQNAGWQSAFGSRLNMWRRIRAL